MKNNIHQLFNSFFDRTTLSKDSILSELGFSFQQFQEIYTGDRSLSDYEEEKILSFINYCEDLSSDLLPDIRKIKTGRKDIALERLSLRCLRKIYPLARRNFIFDGKRIGCDIEGTPFWIFCKTVHFSIDRLDLSDIFLEIAPLRDDRPFMLCSRSYPRFKTSELRICIIFCPIFKDIIFSYSAGMVHLFTLEGIRYIDMPFNCFREILHEHKQEARIW